MILHCQNATVSFTTIEEIGFEGKNSKVYLAKDNHLDSEIVVKKIKKENLNEAEYFNEAKTLYLSAHPNVVQVLYACIDEDGHICIAMPYYKNGSLKKLMSKTFLTNQEIVKYSVQFLSGLQNIHTKKLLHFDIKPDNIMLSDRSEALLSDFGLVKFVNTNGIASPDQMYPRALPPEAIKGITESDCNFDRRYDIYQAGLTLYRMCVGDKEYYDQFDKFITDEGLNAEHLYKSQLNRSFPNLNVFPVHIHPDLIKTIKKCLHPEVSKRYDSAIDIINSLSNIDGNLLGWRYSIDENSESWQKTDEKGRKFQLTILDGKKSSATKTIDGNITKINKFNLDSIDRKTTLSFLSQY